MIRSKAITQAARGMPCCLNIVNCCNYNNETTVLCHIRDFHGGGTAIKPDDTEVVFGCSACHDAIDRRSNVKLSNEDRYFYIARAAFRTIKILYEYDILIIRGCND